MTKPIPSGPFFLAENEKGDPKGRLAKSRKLVPEARVELARRETTVFETAASAIPPLGHISLHSITEARICVHDKIVPRSPPARLALPGRFARDPLARPAPPVPRPALRAVRPPRLALPGRSAAVRFRPRAFPSSRPAPSRPRVRPRAPRVPSALVQLSSSFRESQDCGLFAGCALG